MEKIILDNNLITDVRKRFKCCDFSVFSEESDRYFMQEALKLARQAADLGEVPVGALVIQLRDNALNSHIPPGDASNSEFFRIVGRAHNMREAHQSPSAHAEFLAIEQAARFLGRWRLSDCCLYVTLEPCLMCAGLF